DRPVALSLSGARGVFPVDTRPSLDRPALLGVAATGGRREPTAVSDLIPVICWAHPAFKGPRGAAGAWPRCPEPLEDPLASRHRSRPPVQPKNARIRRNATQDLKSASLTTRSDNVLTVRRS